MTSGVLLKGNKNLILLAITIILAVAVLVVADDENSELRTELSELSSDLINADYDWLVNYTGEVDSIFYENYSCNSTGYETSKVLTSGVHDLLFEFGGVNATAHNWADNESLVQYIGECGVLNTTGATYYLNASIINSTTSSCIDINSANVTFDCQGYTIDGNDAADYGIDVGAYTNVTVKNCILTDWDTYAIKYGFYAHNGAIDNTTITSCPHTGIHVGYSDNVILTDVNSSGNGDYGYYGLKSYFKVYNSTFSDNGKAPFDFYIDNSVYCSNSEFINNTGDEGKPILFYNDTVTIQNWDNNFSQIILCNADDSVIQNVNYTGSANNRGVPLFLTITDDVLIDNVKIVDTYYGFRVHLGGLRINITNSEFNDGYTGIQFNNGGSDSRIENVSINGTTSYGIYLSYSTGNYFNNITIENAGGDCMYLSRAGSSQVHNSTLTNCGGNGIWFYINSHNGRVAGNTITDCTNGIRLYQADNSIIYDNTITEMSNAGIYFDEYLTNDPNNITVYNNFLNNSGTYGNICVEANSTLGNCSLNTTKQLGTNIYEPENPYICGNFYAGNNVGLEYNSLNCTDSDSDGFCDDYFNFSIATSGVYIDWCPISNVSLYGLSVSVVSPDNTTSHYSAEIDFNVSVSDDVSDVDSCWFELDDSGTNTTMSQFNSSYFNYTYSGIGHGLHNITFWCNNSLGGEASATESNFDVVLLDFAVASVTLPATIYSNTTFIEINITNTAPPSAANVNVSCYLDNVIFDSKLIATINGEDDFITNCSLTTTSGLSKVLNVTVDIDNAHPESDETNNYNLTTIDIIELATFDAWDLEDDAEDKSDWFASEQQTLPDEMEYFFANYTMDNSSASVEGGTCNVTFDEGTYDLLYNSSADLYYYNRTFDYCGNYSWDVSCAKTGFESLSGSGEERVRIPLYNQTSLGLTTGLTTINYNENANLSLNVPADDIDYNSSGYNLSEVWAQIEIPNGTTVNRSLEGECYDDETEILTREEISCENLELSSELRTENEEGELQTNLDVLENNKGSKSATQMVTDFPQEYNNYNDNSYINVYEEKSKDANNVASTVTHKVLTNFNNCNDNNYLNVSVNDNDVEDASVALMVTHQPHELGPHRHLGSIPSWGVSTLEFSDAEKIINDGRDENKKEIAVINRDKKIPDATTLNVDSSRMENARLIPDYDNLNKQKYLKVSVDMDEGYDRMAEWSTQSVDTRCPLGLVGSIPTPIVTNPISDKCYNYSWKLFSDLDKTEEVATLNQECVKNSELRTENLERSGLRSPCLEWQTPTEYQVFDNVNEMFRIETDDGVLVVSEKHRVYSSSDYLNKLSGEDMILNKETINNLPLNSEGLIFLSNLDKSENVVSINGGWIFKTTIPECSFGGNNLLFKKCLSNVNITLESDLAILDSCLSDAPIETFLISCPFSLNSLSTAFGKFSSERNFNLFLEKDIFFFSDEFGSICQNRKDSRACELREIILENLVDSDFCSEQFHDLPDHDSCSFESGGASADFSISHNEFVDINSHVIEDAEELFKSFDLQPIKQTYKRFKSGEPDIYFLDSNNKPVKVNSISKINNYSGKIYDVDVENDIVLVRRGDLVVWSGNSDGGIWNLTYNPNGVLGDYALTYFANLTNSFDVVRSVTSNFSVQNTTISISSSSVVNTTDIVNVQGVINRYNRSDFWAIADNKFTIELNNVIVSSDTYNYTNPEFANGTGDSGVNVSEVVQLNLTSEGQAVRYYDDYSTSKYLTDAEVQSYSNLGYTTGRIFENDQMTTASGNITYRFTSVTRLYNATAYAVTQTGQDEPGANTSILYSVDNSTWIVLDSTTSETTTIGGVVPVDLYDDFYIQLQTQATGLENPVESLEVNYTSYNYSVLGSYVSGNITLEDVTYTVLQWSETLNSGDIKIQLRESDDGISWDSWGSNYTSGLDNDITAFTKTYLQFRAWLETTNQSLTPVLHEVRVLYFNASTNSTGGYNYNITIPTNTLGSIPLEVAITQNDVTGIVGSNSTDISVWARTDTPYSTLKNYTAPASNYSVAVNFTRTDTDALVNGTINITISNSTDAKSTTCTAKDNCMASWIVPTDLSYGNYTVNITAHNESGYYVNSSTGFDDYLEDKNTTGSLNVPNKTVGDYTYGSLYSFLWDAEIDNTGQASMLTPYIYDVVALRGSAIQSIAEHSNPCSRIFPQTKCNVTMNITLKDDVSSGHEYRISWKANYTNNDATIGPSDSSNNYISAANMYVDVVGNATLELSNYSQHKTIQHQASQNFTVSALSTGSDDVYTVNISFVEGNITGISSNISASWINVLSTNPITIIEKNTNSTININITVPVQTAPATYTGKVNVSASIGGEKLMNLTVVVLTNSSWYLVPDANFTYNNSFELGGEGEVGNFTVVNIGNINLTMAVAYSPSGTINYEDFGVGVMFDEDDTTSVPGILLNPTEINITKAENSTITLYQKGDASPFADIGIIMAITNATANPVSFNIEDAWHIEEQPPAITGVWFYLDGVIGNIAAQNSNVTIKLRATDDQALNTTATTANISWSGGATQIDIDGLDGVSGEYVGGPDYTVLNYSGNYTPTTAGFYEVIVRVEDNSGRSVISSTYNFTSYGTTTMSLEQNFSSASVANVDLNNKGFVYVNYTINTTGLVRASTPSLNFSADSSIVIADYLFNDLPSGNLASHIAQFNVSKLTSAGDYNVTATLTWTNPNTGTGTDSEVFTITVAENKSISVTPSTLVINVESGSSNSSLVQINNTGNTALTSVDLSCYTGTLCTSITVGFNESDFAMAKNSSQLVNVTFTAGSGLAAAFYQGTVNVSDIGVSKTFDVQSTVPETKTWIVSPTEISAKKGSDNVGNLEAITINNTGNVAMTWNLGTTNSSLFNPNSSSLTVALGGSKPFMINYSASVGEGTYIENITITNTDAAAVPVQRNVTITMVVTSMEVNILYPTLASPLTNLTAGDLINITANLTYGDELITSQTTWNVSVGVTECLSINYSYNAPAWNINCTAPDVSDGNWYNLTLTATHATYGERVDTEHNATFYADVTPPGFEVIRNNIDLNDNMNLTVNVSDNVEVGTVLAYVTYPNLTESNLTFTQSGGYYVNVSHALDLAGEYLVNYTANDSSGNFNSTLDWFEVYDRYYWNVTLVDFNSVAVADANISFYRPNSTEVLYMSNVTDAGGATNFYVNKRFYDINAKLSYEEFTIKNADFSNSTFTQSNISLNFYRIDGEDLSEIISLHKPFIGIASNSTGFGSNEVVLDFNYSGYNYDLAGALDVVKCADWNYTARSCTGSWAITVFSRDPDNKILQGNSTGFSTYFLAENKCGNGACEVNYAETSSSCPDDCTPTTVTVSGGGGGGGGGISGVDLEKIEQIIKSYLNVGGVKIETTSIYKELFAGDTTTFRISLVNSLSSPTTITLSAEGEIKDFLFFENSHIELGANEERSVIVKVIVPRLTDSGNYDGDLVLTSGENKARIPVTIRVLAPEGKLLDVKIQPLTPIVAPGDVLRLQADLMNLGKTKKVDIQFDLQLIDLKTGDIITRQEEAFAVETTFSSIKNLTIPDYVEPGRYMVKAVASYSNIEFENMQATSIAYVNVQYPFFERKIFGVYLWMYFVVLAGLGLLAGGVFYIRWLEYKKKRFKTKLDVRKLPHANAHSGFIGKIAETDIRTFIDLNKMQTHMLVAGATGSGKTIAAQDLVETALLHKRGVIVFDPTAQWSGFLRKCEDATMLKRYKFFDMKKSEAKAFNGSIKTIRDPYEIIDIKKYMNRPGEITIFNVSNLTPKEIDIVVSSTIEQIFQSRPEESKDMKTLVVYDEVHRLLPKFGGSGQGFIQLERGAREFRKWGIGLLLISQVLSDFVGEVKANIGTEIQMGTRYEGDLERVNMKYGDEVLKSVVKEQVGTGMVVNAEYNNGSPYFVSFRPILHGTKRLTNVELQKYEEYFNKIEDLDYQTLQLKNLKVDTLDLELELKLSKAKIKSGQFQMADMYLETLVPKIEETWKNLGKKPMHLVKKKIRKEEVVEGVKKAKIERAKYIRKHPQKTISLNEKISLLKKKIEENKKQGKDTSQIELKLKDLEVRVKPFKGKVPSNDVEGINNEIKEIEDLIGSLKKEEGKRTKNLELRT